MVDVLFRKKANALQRFCLNACEKAFKEIGYTTFFRCVACHKIVTAEKILANGRCWCNTYKFRETNLTLLEEFYWVGRALWKNIKAS